MRVTGEIEITAPAPEVWDIFLDPERLCAVMPGCEHATRLDATRYEATLATKVQFMTIRARASAELLEVDPPTRLVAELMGETAVLAGAFRATMEVDLTPSGAGSCLRYTIDLSVLGRLGSLGEPIIRSTASRLAAEFATNISSLMERGGALEEPAE